MREGKKQNKQDRQCTCDVTLRRVRVTIVVMEKQQDVLLCSF